MRVMQAEMAAAPPVPARTDEKDSTRRIREIFERAASIKEGGSARMTFTDFQKVPAFLCIVLVYA